MRVRNLMAIALLMLTAASLGWAQAPAGAKQMKKDEVYFSLGRKINSVGDTAVSAVVAELDGVREGEAVGVLTPFLHEGVLLVELEQVRSLRATRRAGVAGAREDEEVLLRVDGDAFGFTDGVAGRHQRQFDGIERNLGGVLLELVLGSQRRLLFGRRSPAGTLLCIDAATLHNGRSACSEQESNDKTFH